MACWLWPRVAPAISSAYSYRRLPEYCLESKHIISREPPPLETTITRKEPNFGISIIDLARPHNVSPIRQTQRHVRGHEDHSPPPHLPRKHPTHPRRRLRSKYPRPGLRHRLLQHPLPRLGRCPRHRHRYLQRNDQSS